MLKRRRVRKNGKIRQNENRGEMLEAGLGAKIYNGKTVNPVGRYHGKIR